MTLVPPAQQLEELVRKELKGYSRPEYVRQDGTTWTFRAIWNPYGLSRLIQVDKENPESPSSKRALQRGNNLDNATRIVAKIQHEGVLVPVHTFNHEETRPYGINGTVTVVDELRDSNGDMSRNLEEILSDPKTKLKDSDKVEIAKQILHIIGDINEGMGVIGDTPIAHRDVKPSNIVVRYIKGRPNVKIVDWSLAREIQPERTYSPVEGTGGTRQTLAPELRVKYGQEPITYCEKRAEIFSTAATIADLLSGQPIIEFDGDNWKFTVDLSNDKWLPKKFRQYYPTLRRALSINPEQRTDSVINIYQAFTALSEKKSSISKWLTGLSAAAVLIGSLAGTLTYQKTKTTLETQIQGAQIDAQFKRRYKAIDLWQQNRAHSNLTKDPENKNQIYFSERWDDDIESAELSGWLDIFNHWDYKNSRYLGDHRTAFAAFLDSTLDHYPDVVLEAVMKVNKITDPKEVTRRLKENDPTLVLNYDKVGEEIKKLDQNLYWQTFTLFSGGPDNISRMMRSDRYSGVSIQLDCASEVYQLKRQREAEISEIYAKAKETYKGVGGSGIIGDTRQFRVDMYISEHRQQIDEKYERLTRELSESHFRWPTKK